HKISIALEEMNIPYKVITVDLSKGEQKTPEYIAINPNGRIPAIIDHDNEGFTLFESGAILIYLAEKSGNFYAHTPNERALINQWLMFQMGGIGPMMGQANVFFRYFPEKIPAAIDRYHNEVKRLFGVLDSHLSEHEYLVNNYSIADIANWAWVRTHNWSGVEIDSYPNLERWVKAIYERPAALRAIDTPKRPRSEKVVASGQKIIVT
ncbi:glutathione S-transferase family protein, partial [Oleiphilus sp. HI0043]|uniref:glutathione S-transferase family protein n=3 Tax=Oleiphilus TaxID=141450 RepID=UPI000838442A